MSGLYMGTGFLTAAILTSMAKDYGKDDGFCISPPCHPDYGFVLEFRSEDRSLSCHCRSCDARIGVFLLDRGSATSNEPEKP